MEPSFDHVELHMSFKEFVENVKGLRLIDLQQGTLRYRRLLQEFNQVKRGLLDAEALDMRIKARALPVLEPPWSPEDGRNAA